MSIPNKLTSRRGFLQGSAGAAGLLATPLALGVAGRDGASDSPEQRAQKAFIEAVLQKQTGRSRKLNQRQIRRFAERFTQEYGVVDYRRMYRGIAGEYRLTRLFVRSVRYTATSQSAGVLA